MTNAPIIIRLSSVAQDSSRGTMTVLHLALERDDGHNARVAAKSVCRSAFQHLLVANLDRPEPGSGVGEALSVLLHFGADKTVVGYVPDRVIYQADDEAKNDALWVAIAGRMDENSLALFNEALIHHLSKVTRHDVWSRSTEKALESLVILTQILEMDDDHGRIQ